jgi:hypothetical protein
MAAAKPMGQLAELVEQVRKETPILEFRFRTDWFQWAPLTGKSRWRHFNAVSWSIWRADPGLFKLVGADAVGPRLVQRDFADLCSLRRDPAANTGGFVRGVDYKCEECHSLSGSTQDQKGFFRCKGCGFPAP